MIRDEGRTGDRGYGNPLKYLAELKDPRVERNCDLVEEIRCTAIDASTEVGPKAGNDLGEAMEKPALGGFDRMNETVFHRAFHCVLNHRLESKITKSKVPSQQRRSHDFGMKNVNQEIKGTLRAQ